MELIIIINAVRFKARVWNVEHFDVWDCIGQAIFYFYLIVHFSCIIIVDTFQT